MENQLDEEELSFLYFTNLVSYKTLKSNGIFSIHIISYHIISYHTSLFTLGFLE